MCHVDRQWLGLSPWPSAHLSLHFWNYHSNSWCQLSLLCQSFTKICPCKSSYLAAIPVSTILLNGRLSPLTHFVPIQGQPHLEEKKALASPTFVALRRHHARSGGMAPDRVRASVKGVVTSLLLIPFDPFVSSFPSLIGCFPYVKLFLFIPHCRNPRPNLRGFPAVLQITYYPSSSPVQSILENTIGFVPKKSAHRVLFLQHPD